MSTALEQRSVELETRLAFQEQALAELRDALAAARIEAAGHADLLQRTLAAMLQSRGELYADTSAEPPPPHYCAPVGNLAADRSEERRVGEERVKTCGDRWW